MISRQCPVSSKEGLDFRRFPRPRYAFLLEYAQHVTYVASVISCPLQVSGGQDSAHTPNGSCAASHCSVVLERCLDQGEWSRRAICQ